MDRERVHATFVKFADKSTTRIPSTRFPLALQELDIRVPPDKLQQLFKEADIDQDGGLDLEEFRRVIARPTELEQWCSTLPTRQAAGLLP
jgi:Ca2+-binding EF-hand superfamily protein